MPHHPSQPGSRPLLPAPTNTLQRSDEADEVTSQSYIPLPKRYKVTPVACVPCQQRKSKCDGNRPICYACVGKDRTDCRYDSTGDIRRNSTLKHKIKELEKDKEDLETIIRAVAANPYDEAVQSYVRSLPNSQFQSTADVSAALRDYSTSQSAVYPYPSVSQMQTSDQSILPMQLAHTNTSTPYTMSTLPSTLVWSIRESVYSFKTMSWETTHPLQASPWKRFQGDMQYPGNNPLAQVASQKMASRMLL